MSNPDEISQLSGPYNGMLPSSTQALLREYYVGPLAYQVELNDSQLWKRHIDQLVKDSSQGINKNDIDKKTKSL